jgi:hypothetical protein
VAPLLLLFVVTAVYSLWKRRETTDCQVEATAVEAGEQPLVKGVAVDQLVVAATADDLSAVEHEELVRGSNGRGSSAVTGCIGEGGGQSPRRREALLLFIRPAKGCPLSI